MAWTNSPRSARRAVSELSDGQIHTLTISPADVGLAYARLSDLQVNTADESAAVIRDILAGKPGPHRDIAVLNAAGALVVAGMCPDLKAGIARATGAIDSGAAKRPWTPWSKPRHDEVWTFCNFKLHNVQTTVSYCL